MGMIEVKYWHFWSSQFRNTKNHSRNMKSVDDRGRRSFSSSESSSNIYLWTVRDKLSSLKILRRPLIIRLLVYAETWSQLLIKTVLRPNVIPVGIVGVKFKTYTYNAKKLFVNVFFNNWHEADPSGQAQQFGTCTDFSCFYTFFL